MLLGRLFTHAHGDTLAWFGNGFIIERAVSASMTTAIAFVKVVFFCEDHIALFVVVKINMFNHFVRHQ